MIVVILLLVSSLVTGLYFTMNKSTPVQTSPISPESKLDLKVPPTSSVVKPPLQATAAAMIPKPRYPKAKTIKVGKTDLISKWYNRYINLMEVYVYDKDGKNIALKKPIASNTPGFKDWVSKFNDGDEMTLGHTGGDKQDDSQPQRQSFEIDLGSMQEIHSVVIVDRRPPRDQRLDKLKVMLLDDDLQMVTKTSKLTAEQAKKGSKHKFDFGTSKWSVLPVDCVGKWGEWSKCSASCVTDGSGSKTGTQKRDWITLRKAENGGKACVYDLNKDGAKECKTSVGTWTSWSGCQRDMMKCSGFKYKKFELTEEGSDGGLDCPRGLDGVRVLPCVSRWAGAYRGAIDCDHMYYRVHPIPGVAEPYRTRNIAQWMKDEDLYASIQNLDKGVIGTTQQYLGIIAPDTRPVPIMCEGNWNRYAYAKTGKIPGINDAYPKCNGGRLTTAEARKLDLEMIEKEKEFTATNPKPFRKITL